MPRPSSSVVSKNANYVATVADELILCTGTITITLPTAVGIQGHQIIVKNVGTGTITINTTSSQTIDGSTSLIMAAVQWDAACLESDGSNWVII